MPPFHDGLTNEEILKKRYEYITQKGIEEEKEGQNSLTKNMSSIYDSYLSTPNFIKRLCEISDGLIGLEDKRSFLMRELQNVNKQLPAACYIPFVN